MFKRAVAAVFWFVSTWWAYALVAYFLGLPAGGGVVLGALLAAFVAMDPTRAFWGPRKRHEVEANLSDVLGLASQTR